MINGKNELCVQQAHFAGSHDLGCFQDEKYVDLRIRESKGVFSDKIYYFSVRRVHARRKSASRYVQYHSLANDLVNLQDLTGYGAACCAQSN